MGPKALPCYVLTIDSADGARRRSAESQIARLGINAEFIIGFDSDHRGLFSRYSAFLNTFWYRRSLTAGEIAVYCGHRLIWQRLLESGEPCALVLEDDFAVTDRVAFIQAINDARRQPDGWDVLKLFDFRSKRPIRSQMLGRTPICAFKYSSTGAVAYLISRNAAQRLLSRKQIFRPVDDDMSWSWEFGLRIWSVVPNPVKEVSNTLGGSNLDVDRVSIKKRRLTVRLIWGNVLQLYKLVRSVAYRHALKRTTVTNAASELAMQQTWLRRRPLDRDSSSSLDVGPQDWYTGGR